MKDHDVQVKTDLLLQRICRDMENSRYVLSPLGLLEGDMGRLLFLLEYYRFHHNRKAIAKIRQQVVHSFERVEELMLNPTLGSGLLGYLSFLDYFSDRSGQPLDMDRATRRLLENHCWGLMRSDLRNRDNYDYMVGAVAYGHYLLDRNRRPEAIHTLLDYFDRTKIKTGEGVCWKETEGIFPLLKRRNTINLGMAHGTLPVLLFLLKCYRRNVKREKTGRLVRAALRDLESRAFAGKDQPFRYPGVVENGIKKTIRHGWCYGDAGIASLFLQSSQVLDEPRYARKALAVAEHSCRLRNKRIARVEDAGICHGAAGLFLQYMVLNKTFHSAQLAETALYWKKKTLAFSRYPDGIGGYKIPTTAGLQNNPGLLAGAAGIGLTLLYEQNGGDAPWLRFLLLQA